MKLTTYILCSSAGVRQKWLKHAVSYDDLMLAPVYPVQSPVATVRALADAAEAPFLVCRDYVWLGRGIGRGAARLIEELDRNFPNWALCGNRGMQWDGTHLYDYTQDVVIRGLQTALCPHPVICLDDNLLLVNPHVMRRHTRRAPCTRVPELGVLLSLECLQNGSMMAVSPRLMTVRAITDIDEEDQPLSGDRDFREYYRRSFLNHYFPTPNGEMNLSDVVDYRYVSEPWRNSEQADVVALFDKALASARVARKPSITICCRTQFRRPELFERCVLSLAACRQNACGLAEVRVSVITDQSPEVSDPVLHHLRQTYPAAGLECWFHEIRPHRHSRADLLFAAIERAETDYIWFIDDDDFVRPDAMAPIARSLVTGAPVVVVGTSVAILETWKRSREGRLELLRADPLSQYPASGVFEVLKGINRIPICSMILPVRLMQERLCQKNGWGDYNEDYFLLLLALTAPRVEVCVLNTEIAAISSRGTENTGAEADRSRWHLSYTTFMSEVLNNEEGNSPFLWQQANRHMR